MRDLNILARITCFYYSCYQLKIINKFLANFPIFCLLKTLDNLWYFLGVQNSNFGQKWVKCICCSKERLKFNQKDYAKDKDLIPYFIGLMKLNFFRSAICHMKTRVCLKYIFHDCRSWHTQCACMIKSVNGQFVESIS